MSHCSNVILTENKNGNQISNRASGNEIVYSLGRPLPAHIQDVNL
jgi:hypothetical protein